MVAVGEQPESPGAESSLCPVSDRPLPTHTQAALCLWPCPSLSLLQWSLVDCWLSSPSPVSCLPEDMVGGFSLFPWAAFIFIECFFLTCF